MRKTALEALASQSDPAVPGLVLANYAALSPTEKSIVVATLSGRPDFALALLDAVGMGKVPRGDVSAFAARQMQALPEKKVRDRLAEVWGTLRPTAQDRKDLLPKYLSLVPPGALKKADRTQGRQLFVKHCAACHTLFGEGGTIGPDLTGSQRASPEYLLTKLLDPSAVVSKDHQMMLITLADGRTLSGVIKEENPKTLVLQTPTEQLRLATADVEARKLTGLSLMPEGLLQQMSEVEIRDLIGYVAGEGPVASGH
jgi:putative heme-binding domain-containing protein